MKKTKKEIRAALEDSLALSAKDAIQLDPGRLIRHCIKNFPTHEIPARPEHENICQAFHGLIQLKNSYDYLLLNTLDLLLEQNPKVGTLELQRELRRMNRMTHDIVRAQLIKTVASEASPEEIEILLDPLPAHRKTQKAKRNHRTH